MTACVLIAFHVVGQFEGGRPDRYIWSRRADLQFELFSVLPVLMWCIRVTPVWTKFPETFLRTIA